MPKYSPSFYRELENCFAFCSLSQNATPPVGERLFSQRLGKQHCQARAAARFGAGFSTMGSVMRAEATPKKIERYQLAS